MAWVLESIRWIGLGATVGTMDGVAGSSLNRHAPGLSAMSAAAAAAVTVSISAAPQLRFAYFSPTGYVALETTAGLVSGLAAFLALGRYRLSRTVSDLALVWALGLLGAAMLLFFAGPAISNHEVGRFAIWARSLAMLFAALAFIAAAYAPDDLPPRLRRRWVQVLAGYGASAAVALAVLFVIRPAVEIPDELPVESLQRPLLVGSPALLVWQLLTAAAFAVATFGFVRRCREREDATTLALALAMPLACGASIHNFLFPSPYPNYVFTGDLFRLSFFLVVLGGALAQISAYQRAAEQLGMRRERQRLARELHDGPVQELALLRILIEQVAKRDPDPAVARLHEYAVSAVDEWRRAMSDEAAAAGATSVRELLATTASRAAAVGEAAVEVQVDGDERALDGAAIIDLQYLVREATSNAVRHGGAKRVRVRVTAGRTPAVVVDDDGCGFDPAAVAAYGHGLYTMRERARRLGGELHIDSSARGTRVAARPPSGVPTGDGRAPS
jgi:signal transduction histidine kinase